MKRYEDYKPTGAEWIPSIPASWDIQKIGALFAQRKEKVSDKDFAPISVTKNGILPQLAKAAKTDDGDNRKKVCVGDFVINSRSDRKGSCGVSDLEGSVSLINIVLQPRDQISGRYAHYLLRNHLFSEEYYRNGRGIVADLWTTRYSEMKTILLPVPPREEQDQIVRYLDWQVSIINRLIVAKRKEIERIQEHLDKSIEIMFDEIASAGNDSIPLGRHITSIESGTSVNSIMGTADNDSIGVLSTSCVYGNNFDLSQNKRVAPSDYGRVSCPVKKNTLIISRMNAPSLVGACGFSEKDDTRVYLPDRLWQVRFDNALMPEYAWRYLSTKRIKSWFATIATGTSSSMKNITKPQLKSIQIPSPSLEKQAETVRRIKTLCDKCNAACHVFEESIMHLIDLRTRLISDVVTGQVDVRGIEVPEYEHVDDIDAVSELTDESDEDTEVE